MKKLHLLGVALVAVFAFAALTATSASAVTFLLAEWLVNGLPITAELDAEASGELELEETIFGLKIVALCSGIGVGTIGPDGLGKGSELLSLTGVAISLTALTGTALECANDQNCPEPLVWAVHPPWDGIVELMEEGTEVFFVGLGFSSGAGNPGYYIECMGTGTTDECTVVEGGAEITNEANGTVMATSSEAFTELAGLKLGNCTTGGNETALVTGLGIISVAGGGLSVSE